MHLHLVIPGLLWPSAQARGFASGLDLPALSLLLGRAHHQPLPAGTAEQTWRRLFGIDPAVGDASLRRLGEADAVPGDAPLICADPTHLHFAREYLLLTDAGELAIQRDEADAMIATLNAEFVDIGRFEAPAPDRWYLHPLAVPTAHLSPLSAVTSRPIVHFLPDGGDALIWQRTMNEIQVVLHNHPLNQAREARGQRPVNSVWFWGAGAPAKAPAASIARVFATSPLVRGLARAAGIEALAPTAFDPLGRDDALVELSAAYHPSLYLDLDPWQAALRDLERHWFAPALAALKTGALKTLTLTVPDERGGLQLTLGRRQLWRFWRAAQSLEAFTLSRLS